MTKNIQSGGFLDAFWLKLAMLLPMVLDHMYYYLFPHELWLIHCVSRVVAPVFAFLSAQAMLYTHNRKRYILRLFCVGVLMAAGNLSISAITGIYIPNNIFLSLAVGASLIYCADRFREGLDRPFWLALCVLVIAASMYCEGKYIVPLTTVVCYYLHDRRALMYGAYIVLAGLPYAIIFLTSGHVETQSYMIFAVLPMALYNGKRGPSGKLAKGFFYIFYPLHIWLIVFIKAFAFTA